jgi:deazaflavin-dependent oxidoreductase (nitroreductase family)
MPDEPINANEQVVDEFRATNGTPGGRLAHLPLLLLTTIGARSGRRRTVPLTYVAHGESFVIAAGAAEGNPAWLHNVLAQPAVTVEIGAQRFDAVAQVTAGAERQLLFERFASEQPQLRTYQAQADRDIAMVLLTAAAPPQLTSQR